VNKLEAEVMGQRNIDYVGRFERIWPITLGVVFVIEASRIFFEV
jgi:hypothetical protein